MKALFIVCLCVVLRLFFGRTIAFRHNTTHLYHLVTFSLKMAERRAACHVCLLPGVMRSVSYVMQFRIGE